MTERDEISIGSTVFVFDDNHRVYARDANGRSFGGPIWREHWRPERIAAETSRSWVTQFGRKIPKRGPVHGIAFDVRDVDRAAWVHDHSHKIADRVSREKDFDALVRVASVIGYEVEPPPVGNE